MSQSLPQSKRDKIVYLLDHWDEIHSPPASGYGGSSGSSTPHLSPMSKHSSVVELERCLAVLKSENKLHHDHLKAFYGAEWGINVRRSSRKRKGGKSEQVVLRDRVRRPPQWVKSGYVRSGVFRLEELFVGAVSIPEPLYLALTLSSAEIAELKRKRRGKPADDVVASRNIRRPRTVAA